MEVKVIPRHDAYIPNFIVIGSDVMAKAVYTKRLGEKEEMCTECYRSGHFRKNCPESRGWSDYCKEFRGWRETLIQNSGRGEEEKKGLRKNYLWMSFPRT